MRLLRVGLLSLSLAACASAGTSTSEHCRSDSWRSGGALTDFVDSAAFLRRVEARWATHAELLLATLAYDSVGDLANVVIQSRSASDSAKEVLGASLRAEVRPRFEPNTRIYVVLGDEAGFRPRRVTHFRACAPVFRDKDLLASLLQREAEVLHLDRRVTIGVRAHVREDGTVDETRVDRSSGSRTIDEAATRVLHEATFIPGMVEGIPVAVWARFPINFAPSRQKGVESAAGPRRVSNGPGGGKR